MVVKTNKEKALEFLEKYSNLPDVEMFDENKKDILEKNELIEKEINEELRKFSQELLVTIYNLATNNRIKELVLFRTKNNNSNIDALNGIYVDSGMIFGYLEHMDKQKKLALLNLRETDEDLTINNNELLKLSPVVRTYIFKSINGNLDEEKEMFCKQHGINSEKEFNYYMNCNLTQEGRNMSDNVLNALDEIMAKVDALSANESDGELDNSNISSKK